MERYEGSQSKARHNNEGRRFISHFCELTRELTKLERRVQRINEDPQVEEPTYSTNSNNLLSHRTCSLQSRLLINESTIRQESIC